MPLPPATAPAVSERLTERDEKLMFMFFDFMGNDVFSLSTPAGLAANWILYEDPRRSLETAVRSDQAWMQRYLLAYLYYATTDNRKYSWKSCNPPSGSGMEPSNIDVTGEVNVDSEPARQIDVDVVVSSNDECLFTYPTELPGGKVIVDMVPSYRWLSAADECQWGGVACGTTLTETVVVSDREGARETEVLTRAVTSINLMNQNLRGSIVTEITMLPELQVLDLSHNGLRGTLSDEFSKLQQLRLQYNAITGTIPNDFFPPNSTMREFNVGSNFMDGTLPRDMGLSTQLTSLMVFRNKFQGIIPAIGKMPLVEFQGQSNEFNGLLPFDLGYDGTWPTALRSWWAYDNRLKGTIPQNIQFLQNLEDFRVNNNQLFGPIPESIQELKRLYRFEVQSNYLGGTVPAVMGDIPGLTTVKVQENRLTGVIPLSLCFLDSMEVLEADCIIPTKLEELQYAGDLSNLILSSTKPPVTECYCCTACCNSVTGECVDYST